MYITATARHRCFRFVVGPTLVEGGMEKEIVARLEAAVARLEALAAAGSLAAPAGVPDAALAVDPAVVAFDELVERSLGRLSAAADKIGGKVQEATKILAESFAVLKELLVKAKQCQVRRI